MKSIFIIFISIFTIKVNAQQGTELKPGALDESFANGGKYILFSNPGNVNHTTVQQDDKILQTGGYYGDAFNGILLVRYEKDGRLDNKFGDSGFVLTKLSPYYGEMGQKVAALENGKTLVMVTMKYATTYVSGGIGVLRYNSDGTLDSSFGENGLAVTFFSNGIDQPSVTSDNLVVQEDGKILIDGDYNPDREAAFSDLFVIRYTQEGKTDRSFGVNGIALFDFAAQDYATDMELRGDGKIMLMISHSGSIPLFLRLLTDGSKDESFGNNGVLDPPSDAAMLDLAIQADGKMLTTGGANKALTVTRYNEDGSMDKTFGIDGKASIRVGNQFSVPRNILVQNDGKIVVAGNVEDLYAETIQDFLVVRFNEDGNIDSTFGENGKTTTDFSDVVGGSSYEVAQSVELQSDGKIILGGYGTEISPDYRPYFALARYHGDPVENPVIAQLKTWLRNNTLGWYTSNNSSVNYYSIQRSPNGSSFKEEKRVQANNSPRLLQQANTREQQTFTYALNTAATNSYYRVAAVLKDGSTALSPVVYYGSGKHITLYPNPVKDVLTVKGLQPEVNNLITISDVGGNVLLSATVNSSETFNYNVSRLKGGQYVLRVQSSEQVQTLRFMKE